MFSSTLKYLTAISLFIVLYSCKKQVDPLQDNTSGVQTSTDSSFNTNKAQLLQLVNKVRQSGCNCGTTVMPPVNAVTWNNKLALAAYNHSKDMETQDYFSHTGKNGSDPGTRITSAGYSWRAYGENIASGYPDEQAVMTGWINSEGHCKNIMSANFKEMGAGRAGTYWTQEFGAQ